MKNGFSPNIVKAVFKEYKLPEPVFEYRFHPTRKWRFDIAFPEIKLAIEAEGGIWTGGAHARGKFIVRDMEKYNIAQVLGWIVLRYVPSEVLMLDSIRQVQEAALLQQKRMNTPISGGENMGKILNDICKEKQ